jgi:serine phosphatase RsbU (regulator of sigma subunit)
LRLHVETDPALRQPQLAHFAGLPQLTEAFQRATGWSLEYHAQGGSPAGLTRIWSAPIGKQGAQHVGELCIDANPSRAALSDADDVAALGDALAKLLDELTRTQTALWHREAELATGVPIVSRADESAELAERLEAILKSGADSLGCQAAAMYLLDAQTTTLKLRSLYRLPRTRLLDAPRTLDRAPADLEALAGHVITLATAEKVAAWNAPEKAVSALCVPISTPTVPLGTLWTFGDQPRDFSDADCNLAEVVAGRLAVELERQVLLAESRTSARIKRAWRAAQELDQQQSQRVAPCLDGWELAGWAAQGDDLGSAFYDWHMHLDGTLLAVAAESSTSGFSGALSARMLRSAFRAHAETCQQSHILLDRCNRTFWSQSVGDLLSAATCIDVNAASGLVGYAWAGQPALLRLSHQGHQWLGGPQLAIGMEPDSGYARQQIRLLPGDALLVLGESIEQALLETGRAEDRLDLAAMLSDHRHTSAAELTELVRAFLDSHHLEPAEDRSLLAIKRQA